MNCLAGKDLIHQYGNIIYFNKVQVLQVLAECSNRVYTDFLDDRNIGRPIIL